MYRRNKNSEIILTNYKNTIWGDSLSHIHFYLWTLKNIGEKKSKYEGNYLDDKEYKST